MKVLYILQNLSADSGVTSIAMNIFRNTTKEKIQIDFLVCKRIVERETDFYNEIISNGGNVYYVGSPLGIRSFKKSLHNIKHFFKEHAHEYQAVHLHVPTISYFTLKYAKHFNIPKRIIHSHSSMSSANKIKSFVNRILMGGKRYANVFWTCSPEAAEFLYGKKFLKKHSVEMIKNAVNVEVFNFNQDIRHSLRNELGFENKKIITHISNFSPIKNVFFLLQVIQQIIEKDNDFIFLFIGDGPEKSEFENETKNLGLEKNVKFMGRQSDIRKYLCASDLLLLPSLKEGLPVVTIEAQACGLPCLVNDTITKECNVGLVDFLPLSAEIWIDKICNFKFLTDNERLKLSSAFKDNPYNVVNEAKRVEKLYFNLM